MKSRQFIVIGIAVLLGVWWSSVGVAAPLFPPIVTGVNKGDPVLPVASGYVGSDRCAQCHFDYFSGWRDTLHNSMLRDTNQPGLTGKAIVADSDGDGVDDFLEGLDLGTAPKAEPFHKYGVNAPRLGFDPLRKDPNSGASGVYTITIGPVTYDITRTMGGNGYWKQRYLTRIGNSYYISPVQYNDKTNDYSVYTGGDWYKDIEPKYTNPATLTQDMDKSRSWERRCAGCHVTGPTVSVKGDTGEWVTGYVQLNVGCESCHGPGADHANFGGKPAKIINPRNFLQVQPDGLVRANEVCGQCHSRGESTLKLADKTMGYPAKASSSGGFLGFIPGNVLDDYRKVSENPADYWGLGQVFGGEGPSATSEGQFVASRAHQQQYQDMLLSPHAADKPYDRPCFDCHDPHWRLNEHSVIPGRIEDGVRILTKADDNSLCLSCHAGHGPFANITEEEVAQISSGTTPETIQQTVLDHMALEAGMGGEEVIYQPTDGEEPLGRCTSCHMPKTARSAVTQPDADGHTAGDISSHTFNIIWPSVNEFLQGGDNQMTNSCTGCHSREEAGERTKQIFEWAKSGHADVTANHWRYAAGPERAACVQCHSANGFVDFLAGIPQDQRRTEPKMLTCYACHEPAAEDSHARRQVATVTFPSGAQITDGGDSKMCMNCHQGRVSGSGVDRAIARTTDWSTFSFGSINPHYFPAGATLLGSEVHGGYEYPGKSYVSRSDHADRFGGCVGCHMDTHKESENVGGHTLRMESGEELNNFFCAACHGQVPFEAYRNPGITPVDYDGDGNTTEGVKGEIETLLADLEAALTSQGLSHTDGYPYWTKFSTDPTLAPKQARAAFNHRFVFREPGAFAHNSKYTIQLLRDSYADLTGKAHPGVRP